MVVSEEQLNQPITEETKVEEQNQQSQEEIINTYKSMLKESREQIQQLLKQQELNKKINQQLTETNKELIEKQTEKKHWIDTALENFKYNNNSFDSTAIYNKGNTEQIATWYLQYLKDQGCNNAEISNRMNNIFKTMEGEAPIHEDIN